MSKAQSYKEVTDESLEVAKYHIKNGLEEIIGIIKDKMTFMDEIDNPKALLELKGELLIRILEEFPKGSKACPYCHEYNDSVNECPRCPYATVHGCCFHRDSDYKQMKESLDQSVDAIEKAWMFLNA